MDNSLDNLRDEIDEVDAELVKLIARRFLAVEKLALLKAEIQLPVVDPGRIEIVQDRVAGLAQNIGINPDIARRLWKSIIDEAVLLENETIKGY